MISILGHFSLSAAVLVAAATFLASIASARFRSDRWLQAARWGTALVAVLISLSSAALLTALLRSDFRFEYVTGYTERALPIGYKIAAFWAGQEGSLLLWAWLLCVLCTLAVFTLRRLDRTQTAIAAAAMAVVCGFFAALMLFAANPFEIAEGPVPPDGRGLNPMLQDPGMIAHPPLLFLGYAGYTVPFAVMIGVLVAGRTDNHWLAGIRRWLLASWLFLTAGIVLGAWWAYVELGWGGYWAWDPVENASLLPWLTGTALLHSIMVQQHRGMFKIWNVSLIALSFILCIFGTYLTRSGVIQSVHAFQPSLIGSFFLVFLALCTSVSLILILWRHRRLRAEHQLEGLISREGAFLAGNVLLVLMMVTTLVGTIFPIISSVFVTEPITVKAPFYNRVVAPLGIVLAALMALGPVLAFGRSAAAKIARSLIVPGAVAAGVTALVAVFGTRNPWALVCVAVAGLGTFAVIVSFFRSVSARHRSTGEAWPMAALRLIDRDHRRYGGQLAHLGVMMIVIGVAGSSLFSKEQVYRLRANESADMDGRTVTLLALEEVREANFSAIQATVTLELASGEFATLRPQTRFYDTWSEPNTEVAIRSNWQEDVYVSVAGWEEGGRITAIQVRVNPVVLWIWIGGIVMSVAAIFCMLPPLLPKWQRVGETKPAVAAEERREPTLAAAPLTAETP